MSLLNDSFKKAIKEIARGKEDVLDIGFEKNMNKIMEQSKSDMEEGRNLVVIDSLANLMPKSEKEEIVDIDEDSLLYGFNAERILQKMKETNKRMYYDIEAMSKELVSESMKKGLNISLFEMMKLVIEEIEKDRVIEEYNKNSYTIK